MRKFDLKVSINLNIDDNSARVNYALIYNALLGKHSELSIMWVEFDFFLFLFVLILPALYQKQNPPYL
jgi:hypothetical protein